MEFTLKQARLEGWELAADFGVTQDQCEEMIVPDNSPDVSRIVFTEGNVFLKSSEIRDGKAEISGVLRLSVLYIPEKTPMLQALEYSLPFVMVEDCPKECGIVRAALRLEELSARTLNPRKLQLQCRVGGTVTGYRRIALPFTTELEAEEALAAEKLMLRERMNVITALEERDFSYEETLRLPQNRGTAAALFCSRVKSCVTESKIIGKRAVVKGNCFAEFLIKYDSGRCESAAFELPFSHISELDADADAALHASLILTAVEPRLTNDEDGGGEIHLSLFGRFRLTVTAPREVTILSDVYSTAYETEIERQELQLFDFAEQQTRHQVWQDTLEVGLTPERVLWVSAFCSPVSAFRTTDGTAELRTLLRLRVLYAGEEGRILSVERSGEVLLPLEEGGEGLRCRACCGDDISAVAAADGIVLRVPVDFVLERRQVRRVPCVKELRCGEAKDHSAAPSLVLRRRKAGETLWQLARQYSTASADILIANGCREESELSEDCLLLIPKRR